MDQGWSDTEGDKEEGTGPSTGGSMTAATAQDASRPAGLRLVSGPKSVDPDAEVWAKAKAGDSAAFSALFEKHIGRVQAMCTRMLHDRAEVEDAVQQTFFEAWRSLHRFEGRSLFSTWITKIAIHTCLGFRRKLKRLFFSDDVEGDKQVEPAMMGPQVSPHEGAVALATQRALDEVLRHMTMKKRAVFVLAELEGMTAPEVSEILDIPEATVRTRLFHARKEFHKRARSHPVFKDRYEGGEEVSP